MKSIVTELHGRSATGNGCNKSVGLVSWCSGPVASVAPCDHFRDSLLESWEIVMLPNLGCCLGDSHVSSEFRLVDFSDEGFLSLWCDIGLVAIPQPLVLEACLVRASLCFRRLEVFVQTLLPEGCTAFFDVSERLCVVIR
jgi:hypothetical protein